MIFASHEFWIAVLQIIAIDIVLSGDNAVVIALACRNLPPAQRRLGILWGVAGAVGLRVVLTAFAAGLLGFPWLKLIGGCLLLWIAVKLLLPEEPEGPDIAAPKQLGAAVKTIIVADFVMSLDNVIAVAAAARDSMTLLLFGLAVSIPLIIWSSQIILKLMERFPVIVIYVEVLKDVTFRIAPVTEKDAAEMIESIKSIKLLKGARGEKPSDLKALTENLQRLSQLVTDFPEIEEFDINPLHVFEEGGGTRAVDVRIGLTKA
jgi:YjbE family integral membrane protein